jgi:hypothetical protein
MGAQSTKAHNEEVEMSDHTYNSEYCGACGHDVCVARQYDWPEVDDDNDIVTGQDAEGYDITIFDREPDAKVETGLESWQGGTEIGIFYHKGNTYLAVWGECQNGGPYWTTGILPIEEVLRDYLREMTLELV